MKFENNLIFQEIATHVINLQFFKTRQGKEIPQGVIIIGLKDGTINHWRIRATTTQSFRYATTVRDCKKFFLKSHNTLKDLTLQQTIQKIEKIAKTNTMIYTRGFDNVNWLINNTSMQLCITRSDSPEYLLPTKKGQINRQERLTVQSCIENPIYSRATYENLPEYLDMSSPHKLQTKAVQNNCFQTMSKLIFTTVGLWNKDQRYVPKEIAIVSIYDDTSAHWLISSPNLLDDMGTELIQENHKTTRKVHGLECSDGHPSEEKVYELLHSLAYNIETIYVTSQTIADYLSKFVSCEIINLYRKIEGFGNNLPVASRYCLLHAVRFQKKKICALNTAYSIKAKFMRTHLYKPLPQESEYEEIKPINSNV